MPAPEAEAKEMELSTEATGSFAHSPNFTLHFIKGKLH